MRLTGTVLESLFLFGESFGSGSSKRAASNDGLQ